ncbi:MAG TPA: sensor histidine kinase [Baekduia sp.]|uniref:sensor histidine kinase n=1 Tax=Baekduia sp. TaxID=2600305 RepID=UPI002D7719E5|nr:sensor histidine kinase [Baekduia sp.]HET6506664.1 sensor histidine kinase [Baekduia sp.]
MTLLQRVIAGNALVVFACALVLAISPATVSANVTAGEALLLAVGVIVAIAINIILMRRALAPLRALATEMAAVDLLHPAPPRAASRDGVGEVATVARAYDAMLERLTAERRASGRRAIEAQEAERARIGRELHDEVGQALTGVALELQAGELDAAREALRAASDGVREITHGLRPEPLEDFGLRGALVALASTFADRSRLRVRRELAPALPGLSPESELVVYRVAQEALTNVVRHADARQVVLGATDAHDGEAFVLTVRDDGRGRDGAAEGTGLQGMRERALLVGGRLDVRDADGGGTEVRLEVPVA